MKLILIAFLVLPVTLLANQRSNQTAYVYSVTDTAKKTMSAKEIKQMKKAMKKIVPKEMSDIITKTAAEGQVPDLTQMQTSMTEMTYKLEREEIINDFKNESFDNGKERREAKKEMKEDLKKLKEDYKKELKERRREEKEIKAQFKD